MKILKLLEEKFNDLDKFEDLLSSLIGDDLEDDQIFTKKAPNVDDSGMKFLHQFGSGSYSFLMYCKGKDLSGFGPRELFFYNIDDENIGHARLTKSDKMVSINMIAFTEGNRNQGFGKEFYKYLLDDLHLDIKSDSEITDGTYHMYMSLAREYPFGEESGRAVIYHK